MISKRDLVICADDFGLSAGIDEAVIDLAARGRLTATSCMVAGPTLEASAGRLADLAGTIEIGLHVALTDLAPLGEMPRLMAGGSPTIGSLIRRAHTKRLDRVEIEAELRRQIDRFREIFGRPPAFVDGHQHVHLLGPVRRALLAAYEDGSLKAGETWIRDCGEPLAQIRRRGVEVPKTAFIALLARGLGREAARHGIAANDSFRGVTGFGAEPPFREAFRRFMTGHGRRPLIMCHPAVPGHAAHPTDVIVPARRAEYAYLGGEDFLGDLDAAHARPRRFRDIGA